MEIHGDVAGGFEAVADAFAANFAAGLETGAACALYVDGREVVNLWAGEADAGRPWDARTTAMVYSTTKGVVAICASHLAQAGKVDLDQPVAGYWPEFAAAGKADVTVRMLLNHQAGLPVIDPLLAYDEILSGDAIVEALVAQRPAWEPGTRHGYHALTYGWLVGEVVRRVTGRSLGAYFAEEIAGPLGLDFWIGLPAAELGRVAVEFPAPAPGSAQPLADPRLLQVAAAFADSGSLSARAMFLNGVFAPSGKEPDPDQRRRFLGAEIPSVNGVGDARSLARLYAACVSEVDGRRLLAPDTVERARRAESEGPDEVLIMPTRFGLGFWLPNGWSPLLGESSFGHPGAGGSLAFADPEFGVGFGYVMNQMNTAGMGGDPRKGRLLDAVRRSLG